MRRLAVLMLVVGCAGFTGAARTPSAPSQTPQVELDLRAAEERRLAELDARHAKLTAQRDADDHYAECSSGQTPECLSYMNAFDERVERARNEADRARVAIARRRWDYDLQGQRGTTSF